MPSAPLTAPESFDVIVGALGFATTNARNTAQSRIETFLQNRPRFRDEQPTFNRVGDKYGGVAGLGVTIRMSSRADADALWSDIEDRSFNVLQDGSWIEQNSVTFDAVTGEQTVTQIHRRSFPADPSDF